MHTHGLTVEGCRTRLLRLRGLMGATGVDTALITDRKHVYYYSGHLTPVATCSALVVTGGTAVLMTGTLGGAVEEPAGLVAGEVRTFAGNALGSTIRPNQQELLAGLVGRTLLDGKVGCDLGSCPALLLRLLSGDPLDLTAGILAQRRAKDPDEVALLRVAAGCVDACYRYARERIEPGLNELTLYGELLRTAVETAGEEVGRFGQDFQCASPGGPARDRAARAGELWILDLGVEYRGYGADASRAFAVSGRASDAQQEAWELVAGALQAAADRLQPGLSCLQLFRDTQGTIDRVYTGGFPHHLGHGIGLSVHEAPYLNPEWDQQLAAGDVITVEPGVYHPDLAAGIRLENDFIITADGAEQITHAPLEL
jgi:Xaa-Pro aminopeptidase